MRYEGTVYRPPSEAGSLILQVTIGCAHNQCSFCGMYKEKTFRIRTWDEVDRDIREAEELFGRRIRKIFLADGDALCLPAEYLEKILLRLRESFPFAERITSYGAPGDVLHKSSEELKRLKAAGLDMVYIGLESGDDTVLKRVNKGVNAAQITESVIKLKNAGIRTSVTLISGLGGRERLREHALASADAVSHMNPDYLGFLTLMTDPAAPLHKEIEEGRFHLLQADEVMDEMELFLSHVDSPGTVFRSNHASNYLLLKGTLNVDIPRMLEQVREGRKNRMFRKESWRAL